MPDSSVGPGAFIDRVLAWWRRPPESDMIHLPSAIHTVTGSSSPEEPINYRLATSYSGDSLKLPPNGDCDTESQATTDSTYQKLDGDPGKPEAPKSSVAMASFNFINSIIGSGIIGVPFALSESGFGLGLFLIILVAFINDYSVGLLIEGGRMANTQSYQGLVNAAFGRKGFYLLTVLQFAYPFIAMISYEVIVADTITAVALRLGGDGVVGTVVASRYFITFLVSGLIILPLCLLRDIAQVSKISIASFVLMLFLLLVMITKAALLRDVVPSGDNSWAVASPNFFQAIAILSSAYLCQHNSFMLYTSLENASSSRFSLVTHISVGTSMVLILAFGITGYATFTTYVQGDVMQNYCSSDDLINVARLAFAASIIFTYPMECFVCREVIDNFIFPDKEKTRTRQVIVTVVLIFVTCGLSMTTDCLGIVLELNGVLAAIPLAYILPPLCILCLQEDRWLSLRSLPLLLTILFGIVSACAGIVMTIVNLIDGYTCSHGEEMDYCLSDNMVTDAVLAGNGTMSYTVNGFTSSVAQAAGTTPSRYFAPQL